jgi:ELWxxDGT repeat protein
LYFDANDGSGEALWKSDGTAAGTVKVTDFVDPQHPMEVVTLPVVRRERDQFGREFASVGGIACRPAGIDPHVAAVDPAQLLQRLQECRVAGLPLRIVDGAAAAEHADASHPLRLLRARHHRSRRRAAEKSDEIASSHSMTSSARASNDCGTSRLAP